MPAQSQLYIALPHKNKIILFHRLLDSSGFKFLEYLIKVKCVLSKDQNDRLGPRLHLSNFTLLLSMSLEKEILDK